MIFPILMLALAVFVIVGWGYAAIALVRELTAWLKAKTKK